MKKIFLFAFGMLIFAIATQFVFADTIISESGQRFEGKIIEKTDSYVKMDFQGGILTYNMDEVAKIEDTSKPSTELDDLGNSAEQAFRNGRYEDVRSIMKKMIRLAPKDPELYTGFGIGSYYAGHFEESVSAFKKALDLKRRYTDLYLDLYLCLGIVYNSMGDYEKAREAVSKCVEKSKEKFKLCEALIAEALLKKIGNK
jgi:tetratricopeptide (TPR) repeat protein